MARREHLTSPAGDIEVAGSYEGSNRNLGSCVDTSYGDMWNKFKTLYSAQYTESELRRRHDFWKRLASKV